MRNESELIITNIKRLFNYFLCHIKHENVTRNLQEDSVFLLVEFHHDFDMIGSTTLLAVA